jgi:membrane protease subunit HflK
VLAVWLASGFYIVDEGRRGVVMRFGAYTETTLPGPRWHLPFPLEAVELVDFSQVKTIEIGYRNSPKNRVDREAVMITDDENIIDILFAVQYNIKNAEDYVFQNRKPDVIVAWAAESAIREVTAKVQMDFVLYEAASRSPATPRSCCRTCSTASRPACSSRRSRCRTSSRPRRCRPRSTTP